MGDKGSVTKRSEGEGLEVLELASVSEVRLKVEAARGNIDAGKGRGADRSQALPNLLANVLVWKEQASALAVAERSSV